MFKRKERFYKSFQFINILLILFVSVNSQDEEVLELSLGDIFNIKLKTGSFLELDLTKSPVSMTIIKRDQLDNSMARDITHALEIYVPGFQTLMNKWNGTIYGLRGVASDVNNKILIMVDGNKLNMSSRDGAMAEMHTPSLSTVERIEVLSGPAGLVYGSGAIAGIINIVTKRDLKKYGEISTQFGGYRSGQKYQEHSATAFLEPGNISLLASFAWNQSDGVGQENSKLYGLPSWSYPQWESEYPEAPVSTMGSTGETPGSFVASFNLQYRDLNWNTRFTKQVQQGSGYFVKDMYTLESGDLDETSEWLENNPHEIMPSHPYYSFWAQTESWGEAYRTYIIANLLSDLNYTINFESDDMIKLKAAFSGASDIVEHETFEGYPYGGEEMERFGEKRIEFQGMYLLSRIKNLKLAAGYNFNVNLIGKDLTGVNSTGGSDKKGVVEDVTYFNHALFAEGIYDITTKIAAHAGIRWDKHTRTDGVFSPKVSLIFAPNEHHGFKVYYQSSSNNGTAEAYEGSKYAKDENGEFYPDYHLEYPDVEPDEYTVFLPPVSLEDLHNLKPEKTHSVELTLSNNFLDNKLMLASSISYNKVENIFMFDASSYSTLNTGEYSFGNLDLSLTAKPVEMISVGLSHNFNRLLNTDLSENDQVIIRPHFEVLDTNNLGYINVGTDDDPYYELIPSTTQFDTVIVNGVKSQITIDEKSFLNLVSNLTKIYVDFNPLKWLTVHANAQIYWSPWKGRKKIIENTPEYNGDVWYENYSRNYLEMDSKASIKLNLGAHFKLPMDKIKVIDAATISIMGYNIGAHDWTDNKDRWTRNAAKSQVMISHYDTDIYTPDQASVSAKLKIEF